MFTAITCLIAPFVRGLNDKINILSFEEVARWQHSRRDINREAVSINRHLVITKPTTVTGMIPNLKAGSHHNSR